MKRRAFGTTALIALAAVGTVRLGSNETLPKPHSEAEPIATQVAPTPAATAAPTLAPTDTFVPSAKYLADALLRLDSLTQRAATAVGTLKRTSSPKGSPQIIENIRALTSEFNAFAQDFKATYQSHADLNIVFNLTNDAIAQTKVAITEKAALAAKFGALRMIFETEDAVALAHTTRIRAEITLHAACVKRGVELA